MNLFKTSYPLRGVNLSKMVINGVPCIAINSFL